MHERKVYFKENFFSSGVTEIYALDGQQIGELDLMSMFSSGVEVRDTTGNVLCSGQFPFFSNRWDVVDSSDAVIGSLRHRISFLSKRYEHEANSGIYTIESEAFSREYDLFDENEVAVAQFQKVSTWLEPSAFELTVDTDQLTTPELIVVVMGVNAIQRRQRQHNATV